MNRPLTEICDTSLYTIITVSLKQSEVASLQHHADLNELRPCAQIRELIQSARHLPRVAEKLIQTIDAVLQPHLICRTSIGELDQCLIDARKRQSGKKVAALLWLSCRNFGLAWRQFERRAASTLSHMALQSFCPMLDSCEQPEPAITFPHQCEEQSMHVSVEQAQPGAVHLVVNNERFVLGGESLNALYQQLSEVLASKKTMETHR